MKRLLLAAALLVMLASTAQAAPPSLCGGQDCIRQNVVVNDDGVTATATALGQAGVGAHAGPDGVIVGVGMGITSCHTSISADGEITPWQCYF